VSAALLPAPAEPEGNGQGSLAFGGAVELGGKRYRVQRSEAVGSVLRSDPDATARIFSAFGNPHRILMLRALCDGPKTGQQLDDSAGISSTGQLYHHLKELLAVGLVTQPARSLYELRPRTVIAVCVALLIAADLSSRTDYGAQTEPWPEDV
jgi:DNA-binding transcriptional ArsR family regulator